MIMSNKCKKCINVCDCCAFKDSSYRCIKCVPCGEKFIPRGTVEVCPKSSSIIDRNNIPLLKPGEVIKVKGDLKPAKVGQKDKFYYMLTTGYGRLVDISMSRFFGKKVRISKASESGYYIYEDGGRYVWTDEMFELEDYERD